MYTIGSMKMLSIAMRVLFGLVLTLPILGALVFPPPTADMYSPAGWAFIQAMTNTGYLPWLVTITAAAGLLLLLIGRTALAAVVVAPLTVNIVAFHLLLDNSMFIPSAIPAWVILITNAYALWENREKYRALW